jgi:hypothetical protein
MSDDKGYIFKGVGKTYSSTKQTSFKRHLFKFFTDKNWYFRVLTTWKTSLLKIIAGVDKTTKVM